MPLIDPIAAASEKLILKYNPRWTAHGYSGKIPPVPYGLGSDFKVREYFYYDAALDAATVEKFDAEHEQLLSSIAGETFSVIHRIDAHVMSVI